MTLCDLLSHCLIFCDLFSTSLTLWAVVRSFGGPSSKRRSSTLQPVFLSTTVTCLGAGRPSRLPTLRRAALRRRGGVMGAELGAWRPVRATGGRHPRTTQPFYRPHSPRESLCACYGSADLVVSLPRRALPPSRVVATGHRTRAAHNRLQDSEVARLQCEMDRMKQQHTANILDSMPPWGAQERRCADAAV